MKAYAIRCNQCDYDCGQWIGRATKGSKEPSNGSVSFPILGAFWCVAKEARLAWESRKVVDLLCEAIIVERFARENEVDPEDLNKFVVEEIDWPDDKAPGRFPG